MKVIGHTDAGPRYPDNQDTYWAAVLEDDLHNRVGVILVCDGVGGLEDGSLASQTVVRSVKESVLSGNIERDSLLRSIIRANDDIVKLSEGRSRGMGTTCSLLVVKEGSFYGWHIGDSRLYHFRDGKFRVLTNDHTAFNSRTRRGIPIDESEVPRLKAALSRCLGYRANPQVDFIQGTYIKGDSFVGCSDGFWHFWNGSLSNLEDAILYSRHQGETDNITVCRLDVM